MEDADENLMLRYRNGDAHAFELLYQRHKGPLYRYILRQCGIATVAEELFQDVWMSLIRARERYSVQAKFTTYIYRMAHNRIIDYYRKQSHGIPASFEDDDCPDLDTVSGGAHHNPEQIVSSREQIERLQETINTLPEAQREVFLLHEEGGLGINEIAEVINVNPETAKSRLRYAVKKLRTAIWCDS